MYMWDNLVEKINATKHRIELESPDLSPSHSTTYLSGPVARQVDEV